MRSICTVGLRLNTHLLLVAFGIAFAGIGLVCAQNQPPKQSVPTFDLPMPSKLQASQLASGGFFGTVQCDKDGSIYFRRLLPTGSAYETPVTKLTPEGTDSTINLRNIPGLEGDVYVFTFSVDASGNTYAMVMNTAKGMKKEYLVAFDSDSEFQWKTPLQQFIQPSILVALPNDTFLISGMNEAENNKPTSVTGLFNRNAEMIQSLKIRSDDAGVVAGTTRGEIVNPAIQLGDAKLGMDEYVYLFKAGSHPRVQVLDQTGKTIRMLQLAPPSEDATDLPPKFAQLILRIRLNIH